MSVRSTASLGKFRARALAWCHAHAPRIQFASSHQEEAEVFVNDIAVSMSDMRALTRGNAGPAVLLPQRLEQLGIDPDYVARALPAIYAEWERECALCPSWRRCARDLANSDVQSGLEDYCQNRDAIDEYIANRTDGLQ